MKKFFLIIISLIAFNLFFQQYQTKNHLKKANQYIEQKNYTDAIIELKSILEKDPNRVSIRYGLASVYMEMRQFQNAIKEYLQAKRLKANNEKWQEGLATAYLNLHQYTKVISDIKISPTDSKSHQSRLFVLKGNAYSQLKDSITALSLYEKALALDENNENAYFGEIKILLSWGKKTEALAVYDQLLSLQPDNTTALNKRARLNQSFHQTSDALIDYSTVLNKDPNNEDAAQGKVSALLLQKKYMKALALIKKLDNTQGEKPLTNYLMGLSYYANQDLIKAQELATRVLISTPTNSKAHLLMGNIYFSQGKHDMADYHLQKAYDKEKTFEIAKILAINLLYLKRYKSIIHLLSSYLQSHLGDTDLQSILGTSYIQVGNVSTGLKVLKKQQWKVPSNLGLTAQMGYTFLKQGQTEAAEHAFEKATVLDKISINSEIMLFTTQLHAKKYKSALKTTELIRQKLSSDLIPFNLKGIVYLAQKKIGTAEIYFKKALKIDKKFTPARIKLADIALYRKKYFQAKHQYNEILKYDPKNFFVLLKQYELSTILKNSKNARKYLLTALLYYPTEAAPLVFLGNEALKNGNIIKARRYLNQIKKKQQKLPITLDLKGRIEIKQQLYMNAEKTYRQLLTQLPNKDSVLFALGQVEAKNNKMINARRHINAAIRQNGNNKQLYQRGLIQIELEHRAFTRALMIAETYQKEYPTDVYAYLYLGQIYRAIKKPNQAIKYFTKALFLHQNNTIIIELALTYNTLGEYSSALNIIDNWLKKHPRDGKVLFTKGIILTNNHQNKEAIKAYLKSSIYQENNITLFNNLAWLFHQEGNIKKAKKYAELAYDLAPNQLMVIDTYGYILAETRQTLRATELLQKAHTIDKSNHEITFHLAYALFKLGKEDEARRKLLVLVGLKNLEADLKRQVLDLLKKMG